MFFDTVRYQLFDGKLWCSLFFYLRKFSMPELFWNIERTMHKVSRHCEKKVFQRKLVISPSYAKDVSILEFIWNTEGVPYEIFRYCETKILTKNCDTPPLLFSIKISEVFWNKGFPYDVFSDTVRYQFFDGKVWCPLFFYPQNFSMPENFWNIERTIYKVFQHCEKKDFQRIVVISPSYAKDVSILEFIWNTEGVPYEIFRYCETKILTKNCDTPPLLFSMKISEVFWNKGFPYDVFSDTVRYQFFDGKVWCPLFFYPQNFSMPENFWNIERTIYKVFQHCEKKDFQRIVVISPSYAKDVSILEFIWNTEGVPYEIFRYCETKILKKNRDTPPLLLSIKISDTRSFLKHRRFPLRCFSIL